MYMAWFFLSQKMLSRLNHTIPHLPILPRKEQKDILHRNCLYKTEILDDIVQYSVANLQRGRNSLKLRKLQLKNMMMVVVKRF